MYQNFQDKVGTFWGIFVEIVNFFKHGSEIHPADLLKVATVLSIPISFISYFFFLFSDNFQQNLLILAIRAISLISLAMAYFLSRTSKHYLGSYIFILGGIFLRSYYGIFFRAAINSQLIVICIVAAAFLLRAKETVILSLFLITFVAGTLYFRYDYTAVQLGFYMFSSSVLLISLTLFNVRNENHVNKIHRQAQQIITKEAERQQLLLQQYQTEFHTNAITSISHDLKTPLTIIKLKSAILEMKFSEQASEYTRSITEAVDRITFLINEMNLFDKFDEVKKETWKLVDINEAIRTEASAFSEKYTTAKPIQLNLSATPLFCFGDEMKLTTSIKELLENACVHSGEKVDISVHATNKMGQISLTIRDSGPGVPANQLPKIFDYYFKGDQARTSWQTGSGLGLPLVKLIVSQHEGTISINSEVNEGTCVEILLPLA
ncbi:sensor histidine kinase [Candidatus Leptofilum sp.]|uniref:sensor histidine kinase n=1 Tax=Candidatus Leptofilum sp. TaxID=3241576 RepID=UPI003B58C85E